MLAGKRQITALVGALIIAIFLLLSFYGDRDYSKYQPSKNRQPVTGGYPYVKPASVKLHPPSPKPSTGNLNTNNTVILAQTEDGDTSWVSKSLPGWEPRIMGVNPDFAKLHPGAKKYNKGRIADAYLRYLVENYNNLPTTLVFLNSRRTSSSPNSDAAKSGAYDNVQAVKSLKTDFVQNSGFANLRCIEKSGCLSTFLPARNPPDEFRTIEVAMSSVWKDLFGNETAVPEKLAAPCCSEFAVSGDQIRKHTVDDYLKFWKWLNKTKIDDDTAGLVVEYIWHVIFGKEAEYCMELRQCEYDVYGKC
ncbi:hypothetical protein BDV96DRAFT_570255 [Lophiotrema nucula]|uniref:Uncharacterized protein n=1 Tax=Lophiotrema nucula TaxID=690887 RepID=A0A6A5ZIB7_9PLEO|nr:hypothetical protein BDV96DRAFT_570255 [Lophiotrema nucula]